MENKEKYYIPDISEFYIGFEYEERGEPQIFSLVFENDIEGDSQTKFSLDAGNIRVKCLDTKDIQSFGFKPITEDDRKKYAEYLMGGEMFIVKSTHRNNYELDVLLQFTGEYVIISKEPKKALRGYGRNYLNTVFEGKVKNKSAMKILMNQLNIAPLVNA